MNCKKQGDMQKAGPSIATELPYGKAEELFEELTGMKMSAHAMHKAVENVFEGVDVLDTAPKADEIIMGVVSPFIIYIKLKHFTQASSEVDYLIHTTEKYEKENQNDCFTRIFCEGKSRT